MEREAGPAGHRVTDTDWSLCSPGRLGAAACHSPRDMLGPFLDTELSSLGILARRLGMLRPQGNLQEPPVLAGTLTPGLCVPGGRGQSLSEWLIGMPGKSLALGGGPACSPCGGGLIKGLMVQCAGHQTGHLEAWGLVQLAAALLGDLKQITWPLSAPSAPCLLPVWQGFLEAILVE